jgi:hypothetical protein
MVQQQYDLSRETALKTTAEINLHAEPAFEKQF